VLFFAVSCLNHCKTVELTSNIFINRQIKNYNYFSPEKRKKKERRKIGYAFPNSQESDGCQGFSAKYYPKQSGGVEILAKTRRA